MVNLKAVYIREICEILKVNVLDAVHYTPIEKIDLKYSLSYRYMGNAERDARQNGTYSEGLEYPSDDVGFHFPDITVEQCTRLENNRNPVALRAMKDAASNKIVKTYVKERELMAVTFMVLHEMGHAIHFKQSGLSPFEYSQKEGQYRRPLEKESKLILSLPDFMKYGLVKEYEKKYREIPSEKFSDEYATEHIEEALVKIRESLGYTEEDLKRV